MQGGKEVRVWVSAALGSAQEFFSWLHGSHFNNTSFVSWLWEDSALSLLLPWRVTLPGKRICILQHSREVPSFLSPFSFFTFPCGLNSYGKGPGVLRNPWNETELKVTGGGRRCVAPLWALVNGDTVCLVRGM
jgi:hypothetical protein